MNRRMSSEDRPVPSCSIRSTVVPAFARNLYEVDGPRFAVSNCDLQPSGAEPSTLRKQRLPPLRPDRGRAVVDQQLHLPLRQARPVQDGRGLIRGRGLLSAPSGVEVFP